MRKFINIGLAISGFISLGIAFFLIIYGNMPGAYNENAMVIVVFFIFMVTILLLISWKLGRSQ